MIAPLRIAAVLCLAVLATSGPVMAASDVKAKIRRPSPIAAQDLSLRGALSSDTSRTIASSGAGVGSPPPSAQWTAGGALSPYTSGIPTDLGLTPLKSFADGAPLCRSDCAKARIVCSTTDADECDPHWSICVAGCSSGNAQ